MNVLVVYDSVHGNTEKIAQAIGDAVGGQVLRADDVDAADLAAFDRLIVGFPTEGVHGLVQAAPSLEGVEVAAFDTRTKMTIFGYAAPKIARNLEKRVGTLLFFVRGKKGPLKEGELARAAEWAQGLAGT